MKKMIILTCMVFFTLNVFAKKQIGIYLTAADYKNQKLSYETGSKIQLNNSVATMSYITVEDHGKKLKLKKSDVFGYADHGKLVYRFYKNEEYKIEEAGNITIYSQIEKIAQSKGYKVKKNYYFSTSIDSKIIALTLENLRASYRTSDKFLDLLDQYFNGGGITSYDDIHNTFKVNYVYAKALK